MTCRFITLILFSLIAGVTSAKKSKDLPEYRRECIVWQQEISRIQRDEQRIRVNCSVNAQCTGFDCKGVYTYNGYLTAFKTYQKSICFGLWIIPCSTPSNLSVYIEQTTDHISYTYSTAQEGHHDVDVPGVEETIDLQFKKIKAKLTLGTDVFHLKRNSTPYMKVGLQLKPKIEYTNNHFTYPQDMQVTLVKDVEIPVPKCNRLIPNTTHKAGTCPVVTGGPGPAIIIETTPAHPSGCMHDQLRLCDFNKCFCANATLTKQCKPTGPKSGSVDMCDNGQSCSMQLGHYKSTSDKDTQWYCWCISTFHMAGDQCVPDSSTTTAVPVIYEPVVPETHSTSKKNVIIIASCSVFSIVLALAATSFVVWRYLKHRSRYANHSLLRSQDDDFEGDVPPIDLET